MKTPDLKKYMSVSEAAEEMGHKTASTIRHLIKDNRLRYIRWPDQRTILIERKSLEEHKQQLGSRVGRPKKQDK